MPLPSSTLLCALLASAAAAPPAGSGLPLGISAEQHARATRGADLRPALAALGEKLFKDPRLSVDDSISCASCHDPARGFVDHKPQAEGVRNQLGQRNSPTVLNALFQSSQLWDGRARTLEEQAKLPLINPLEMGQPTAAAVAAKLAALPEYAQAFQAAFSAPPSEDRVAAALAAYERTLVSGDSALDRALHGDAQALDASARRGWALFNGKARCSECHALDAATPLLSDQKFHNIGVSSRRQDFTALALRGLQAVRPNDAAQLDRLALGSEFSELGRFLVTQRPNDVGAFKTPTLRNVGITAPYMHDGSMNSLWDVIDFYNKGGLASPYLDKSIQRLQLTEVEIDDLVALLFSLTDARFAAYAARERARQGSLKRQRPEREAASGSPAPASSP